MLRTFAAVQQFAKRLTATPRRRLALLASLAVVVGLALVIGLWLGPRWTFYRLEGTGLEVELPAAPEAAPAGADGRAGVLFQVRCPTLAVVASGGGVPPGVTAEPEVLVRQAMAQVAARPGISDLDYRVGQERLNGQACLMVAGTFRRDGVPSRLQGAFFVHAGGHGHLLCFWSERNGALQARRVLQSLRLARP